MGDVVVRKINVGRITGLSTYELAVKYGFQGTEQEFVERELKIFNDIQDLAATIPGFNSITCDGSTIQATTDERSLTIETDGCVEVVLDPDTFTMKVGLSQDFKDSLIYRKEIVETS